MTENIHAMEQRAKAALALRDAILESGQWEAVGPSLEKRGFNLEEARQLLQPKIAVDLHNHSCYSDGLFSYRGLLWWAKTVGHSAIGITDHDNLNPALADAILEAETLGLQLIPGLEYTLHRLGGQSWKGLELGAHFFPARRFADFLKSEQGRRFCQRFDAANQLKSEQGWGARKRVNEKLAKPMGLPPIEEEELWKASGKVDPVCPSTLTVILLGRMYQEGRADLLERFPNTRVIYTTMHEEDCIPAMDAPPQDLDQLADMLDELRQAGIRTTLTLNHPEEWLSKCGLKSPDGQPNRPAIRRLIALLLLHEPRWLPFRAIELYNPRNTPESRACFTELLEEWETLRPRMLPDAPPLLPLAATDSHRVTGALTAKGELQGWAPGEDFLFGLGMLDPDHPTGNLEVPENYNGLEMLRLLESLAL